MPLAFTVSLSGRKRLVAAHVCVQSITKAGFFGWPVLVVTKGFLAS